VSACHGIGCSLTAVGLLVALFLGSTGCYVGPRDPRFAGEWADDYSYVSYGSILGARFSGDIRGVGRGKGYHIGGPLLYLPLSMFFVLIYPMDKTEGTWAEHHNEAVHAVFCGGRQIRRHDRTLDVQLDVGYDTSEHADLLYGGVAEWRSVKVGAIVATPRSRPLRLFAGGGVGFGGLGFDNRNGCSAIGPYARAGVEVLVGRKVRTAIGLDFQAHYFWGEYGQSGESVEAGVTRSAVSLTFYW